MSEIPEVLPTPVSDTVNVYLSLHTYGADIDGPVYPMAHQTEDMARQALGSDKSSRFVGIVRVPVSRALIRERWSA